MHFSLEVLDSYVSKTIEALQQQCADFLKAQKAEVRAEIERLLKAKLRDIDTQVRSCKTPLKLFETCRKFSIEELLDFSANTVEINLEVQLGIASYQRWMAQ
jgi:hypothetical protein